MFNMMEEMWKFLKCSANVHGLDANVLMCMVSVDVIVGDSIDFPSKPLIDSVCYLLVPDVNYLLCDAKHAKYSTRWRR
jgi:hypothetical protein